MKNFALFISYLLFTLFCFGQHPILEIHIDTIDVNLKEVMKPEVRVRLNTAVKLNNKYFCIFNETPLCEASWDKNKFIILSDKGKIEKDIVLPNEFIDTYYSDLFIYKNRILLKDYYSHNTYYLDTVNYKWHRIREIDDVIFEDDSYYITFLDYGEWGCKTWIKDKLSNKEYASSFYDPIINILNNEYYITTLTSVRKEKDFTQYPSCDKKYYYNKVKKSKNYYPYVENNVPNSDTRIFFDSISNKKCLEYGKYGFINFRIFTSFIHNNRLYHIYFLRGNDYIGYIDEGKMIPIYTFDKDINIDKVSNLYRNSIQRDNSQLVKFSTKDNNQFGFIDINKNEVNIRYFNHNIDTVAYLGNEKFDMAFDSIFNYFVNNNVTLQSVDSIEQKYGGVDTKLSMIDRFAKDAKYPIKNSKWYFKIQDSLISNNTYYYYAKENSIVKTISMTWDKTPIYKQDYSLEAIIDWSRSVYDYPYKRDFEKKYYEILNAINRQMGSPCENEGFLVIWKTKEGLVIKLEKSDEEEIRIGIYKN